MPTKRDLVFVGGQALLLLGLTFDPLGGGFAVPAVLRVAALGVCAAAVGFGVAALLQLGTSLTPWPSPRQGNRLVTTGLYAWARHPIYAALIAFALGLGLATGSYWRLALALALWAWFWRKARYEEGLLQRLHPGHYEAYAKTVGRFGF